MQDTSTEPERRADDLEVVARAQDGDPEAFVLLVRRYRPVIVAACRAAGVPPVDMDDAIQDGVEAVWRGLAGLRHHSTISTWIYTIARREALRSLTRASRVPVPMRYPSDMPSTESVEGRVAARLAVHQALTRVPAPFREAVVLRDLADWTYREIGLELGISVDTVKSRIARGRANMRAWLTNDTGYSIAVRGGRPWQ